MRRFRKAVLLTLAAVLALRLFAPSASADAPFIDHPRWHEVSAQDVTRMYNDRGSFVVMFFRRTCFNSNLRKTMLGEWMTRYDLDVYGVDCDQDYMPNWVWANIAAQEVLLPVICIGKNGSVRCFTANDSMRSIQKQLQEHLGIYDESEVDFSRLNAATYNGYSTRASTAAALYCAAPADIPADLQGAARSITEGASGDWEKVKAVYDWVTANIYYNYGMLDGTVSRRTSALETYYYRDSVCAGYANLTAALCNAVGVPCRVVSGFATGVDAQSTVADVWRLYGDYLRDGDPDAFAAGAAGYTNHAWNEAYVDGRWLILDTTWGSNNDYYPDQRGKITGTPTDAYFDPDLTWFSDSHVFWQDYSSDLTLTAKNGRLAVAGVLDAGDVAAADYFLLAAYDAAGRLLECDALRLSGTGFSQSLTNGEDAAAVKVFLLDGRCAPVALPYFGKK